MQAAPIDDLAALEAAITARAREFEVPALLDLLASIGYGPDEVEFRGHRARGPQPTLVHAIEFPPRVEPRPQAAAVTITVNLGLLSCRSPLPTYFERFFDDIETHDAVMELLDTLDRSLLRGRLSGGHPEQALVGWRQTQREFLRVFGLDAPIGLSWLFRQVFPELGVVVRRITDAVSVPFASATLGMAELGACSFGDSTRIGVSDMEVVLICEDAEVREGVPWVAEGDRRLREAVFPVLDEVCMSLTVVFVLMDRGTTAKVSPRSYAGYDPMWGDAQAVAVEPWGCVEAPSRVELYRGVLPRREPDTPELEYVLGHSPRGGVTVPVRGHRVVGGAGGLGRGVVLPVVYEAPGRRFSYEAEVRWGARAWYRDEPYGIALRCGGVVKRSPEAGGQPRLWALLRDEARGRVADLLAHEVLGSVESERITVGVIEGLIARGRGEWVFALVVSGVTPMEVWEPEAWGVVARWSSGGTD